MTDSDFKEDRLDNVDLPELDDDKPKPSRWYGGKRRHIPERPRGLYLAYINELIARSHSKRDDGADDGLERPCRDKERWDAERQKAA
jgi:hypothetical protein